MSIMAYKQNQIKLSMPRPFVLLLTVFSSLSNVFSHNSQTLQKQIKDLGNYNPLDFIVLQQMASIQEVNLRFTMVLLTNMTFSISLSTLNNRNKKQCDCLVQLCVCHLI